jgi:putative ABC transport system permease protein
MRFLDRLTIIKEGIGIALDAIRSNKVRASLTIMGVAVGVFVVTAMAAAVHGIRASFQSDVDAFGATSFQVRRRGIQLGGCDGTDDTCPERRNPALTLGEAAAIRRLPNVQAVTVIWGDSKSFRYHDRYLADVGYDALSSEWLETDAGDISSPPSRSRPRLAW